MSREHQKLEENTVQQTLCIPLWGRKIAAEKLPDFFPDRDAGRICRELNVDFSDNSMNKIQYAWVNTIIRQYDLAWEIQNYLKTHPKAVVVELGAGLSCLRRQMGNKTNPWYCLDMENVIEIRNAHVPKGELEHNIVCDLNDFSWFDSIDFKPEDGIVFTAGGLFYYFETQQVKRLFTAMAEHFPGGLLVFDATNKRGLKGVNATVKASGNQSKSFFSLEKPKEELEAWSPRIVNVSERDYIDGYMINGPLYKKTLFTRICTVVNRICHMAFIVHLEFKKR